MYEETKKRKKRGENVGQKREYRIRNLEDKEIETNVESPLEM